MKYWVVVVDDEPLNLAHVRTILSGEDIRTSCLRSGKELIRFMERNDPDMILLDVMMPEMDGFETYEALREFENENGRGEIPVIFLTGEKDIEAEHKGLKLGASDYIHKPCDKDILISRIKKTISNSKRIESLTEDATIDKLTGFLNKAYGEERYRSLIAEENGIFMILDLDSFKLVNDLFGHDSGDQILSAFADVVRKNIRSGDEVCRIGGDEFAAFMRNMSSEDAVSALTERLNRQLLLQADRLLGDDHGIPLGISVGAVSVPKYGREYETVFRFADEALYKSKQSGKHKSSLYEGSDTNEEEELSPEDELKRIIKIASERNVKKGALVLGTEAFANVYHFVMRFMQRYDQEVIRMLLVLEPQNEGEAPDEKAVSALEDILVSTLRMSDIIMRSRSNQFFLLLPTIEGSNPERVVERIMDKWELQPENKSYRIRYVADSSGGTA